MEQVRQYPTRDNTILDKYLIDNDWYLHPYLDFRRKDISRSYFSTMGLISRNYTKGEKNISIGLLCARVTLKNKNGIWTEIDTTSILVGYRGQIYYLPKSNPEQYLDDLFNNRLLPIWEILQKTIT